MNLLRPLKLLLPALIPSWNFFDWIAPSPRVEYRLASSSNLSDQTSGWREFRPRPASLSGLQIAGRLLFNPRWNESLFVASCAERLVEYPTAHSSEQIFRRIAADLIDARATDRLQFRLVFVSRDGEALRREVRYVSESRPLAAIAS